MSQRTQRKSLVEAKTDPMRAGQARAPRGPRRILATEQRASGRWTKATPRNKRANSQPSLRAQRSNPGAASRGPWIASSQELLAMTGEASPFSRFGNYRASPKSPRRYCARVFAPIILRNSRCGSRGGENMSVRAPLFVAICLSALSAAQAEQASTSSLLRRETI
jgi:hypothetical protein